jgi:hypothetical protein
MLLVKTKNGSSPFFHFFSFHSGKNKKRPFSGRKWAQAFSLKESRLTPLLRRPGCPFRTRGSASPDYSGFALLGKEILFFSKS